jgi:alkylation response protein AidB-like acyl-CoA dehydrogenase
MDLSESVAHERFQDEMRRFLADNRQGAGKRDRTERAAFRQRAIEAGYLHRSVPRAYGGSEQAPDLVRGQIIAEEFGRARASAEVASAGVWLVVPGLVAWSTEEQKQRFVPPTLAGDMH